MGFKVPQIFIQLVFVFLRQPDQHEFRGVLPLSDVHGMAPV